MRKHHEISTNVTGISRDDERDHQWVGDSRVTERVRVATRETTNVTTPWIRSSRIDECVRVAAGETSQPTLGRDDVKEKVLSEAEEPQKGQR